MGLNIFATIKNWLGLSPDAGMHEDVMQLPPEDASCLIDGKAVSITYHPLRVPVNGRAADTLRVTVCGERVVDAPFTESMRVDTVGIFRVHDALGFASAIGAVMGERNG